LKLSRRDLLVSASAASVSAAATRFTTTGLVGNSTQPTTLSQGISPYGKHQAGIEDELHLHSNFISLNVNANIDKPAMQRWMRILSDDIARLAQGQGVLADPQPELAIGPARFTCTVAFGISLFTKLDLSYRLPAGFAPVPNFKIDQLQSRHSDGDVLLHVQADDPLVLNHATRALLRDSAEFSEVHFLQAGFSNSKSKGRDRISQRNLMGQVDGTDNPKLGSQNFADQVWITDGPDWLIGGTQLVLRRIKMNLTTWDTLSRSQKEATIGRNLDNGAPLGKANETDAPDFDALNANGLKLIPEFAHIRRASAKTMDELFFRRPYNYQGEINEFSEQEAGMLWAAYAKDLYKQYVPVQKRLAEFDLLNVWTTPIGSSTWLIPGGFSAARHIAQDLFAS